jgi:hypothetical protein
VFRFDGPQQWASLGKLFDPEHYDVKEDVEDWTRASSLRVFQGKMFCSTATCYRALIEKPKPNEMRGKVFSYETGAGVSYDRDLGPGWKHVAAVRAGAAMKLYVDGEKVAESKAAKPGSRSMFLTRSRCELGLARIRNFKVKCMMCGSTTVHCLTAR